MPSSRPAVAVLLFTCLLAPAAVLAAPSQPQPARQQTDHAVPSTIKTAPADQRNGAYYRQHGVQALAMGKTKAGMRHLRRAAFRADKPAQALMAEILWEGKHGQPVDRPAAYAWMDMAAERGDATLLAQREAYWVSLSADEQAQALTTGASLYRHYGDAAAHDRILAIQRRQAGGMSGQGTNRDPSLASPVALTGMTPVHTVMPAPAIR